MNKLSKRGSVKRYMPWEVSLKEINKSRKYIKGTRLQSTNFGWYTVLGLCNIPYVSPVDGRVRYMWFLIQFDDGTQVVVERPHMASGKVKNPYFPKVFSRGHMGQGIWNSSFTLGDKLEQLWRRMFVRCYDETFITNFPTYKDCEVAERWWNFQNFCWDILQFDNYDNWRRNTVQYHLDKDIKVKGNKVYSKDTCLLVTATENLTEAGLTGKTYIGHRLSDGYEEEFTNQSAFCRKYHLGSSSGLHRALAFPSNTSHGWMFRHKEDKNE